CRGRRCATASSASSTCPRRCGRPARATRWRPSSSPTTSRTRPRACASGAATRTTRPGGRSARRSSSGGGSSLTGTLWRRATGSGRFGA
ncbi:hypothetical protein BN1708_020558, partial [Verticillium longisporum]